MTSKRTKAFFIPPQSNFVIGYLFPTFALLAGWVLCLISWMHLCSKACAEGHAYRLFGFTFESIGLTFFPLITISHLLSKRFEIFSFLTANLLAVSLGAEQIFLYVQKYKIGSWCPVCLSIAFVIAFAAGCYFFVYSKILKSYMEYGTKGQIMNTICKGLSTILFFTLGVIIAFVGLGKENRLEAEENEIKEKIAFGNFNSPIEVYIFTDWECPACRALEPQLEEMAPVIMQKAKISFIDDPVHDATLNFTPYNLSFMIYNKSQYFPLRQSLTALSQETKNPKENQVQEIAAKHGIVFRPLSYAEVALANKYFDQLNEKYGVQGTPTVVVLNKNTQKQKKLEGSDISSDSILKSIKALSSHH